MDSGLTKHESESFSKMTSTHTSPAVANHPNENVFGLVETHTDTGRTVQVRYVHTGRHQNQTESFLSESRTEGK